MGGIVDKPKYYSHNAIIKNLYNLFIMDWNTNIRKYIANKIEIKRFKIINGKLLLCIESKYLAIYNYMDDKLIKKIKLEKGETCFTDLLIISDNILLISDNKNLLIYNTEKDSLKIIKDLSIRTFICHPEKKGLVIYFIADEFYTLDVITLNRKLLPLLHKQINGINGKLFNLKYNRNTILFATNLCLYFINIYDDTKSYQINFNNMKINRISQIIEINSKNVLFLADDTIYLILDGKTDHYCFWKTNISFLIDFDNIFGIVSSDNHKKIELYNRGNIMFHLRSETFEYEIEEIESIPIKCDIFTKSRFIPPDIINIINNLY